MQGLSFSPHNVPLVIAGTKDVTRRLVRFPAAIDDSQVASIKHVEGKIWVAYDASGVCLGHLRSRYYPGETVYLAEQYSVVGDEIVYRADYEADAHVKPEPRPTWVPPWLLSAAMSRHRLLIASMRAERLHTIQGGDVVREGVWQAPSPPAPPPIGPLAQGECVDLEFLRNKYARAWDAINAHRKGGVPWADDPFVWRIETQQLIEEPSRAHV